MALLVPAAQLRFSGNYLVAFGLEWRRLTGLNRKGRSMKEGQEVAQYAGEIQGGASLGVRVRRRATVVGLLPNDAIGQAARKQATSRKAPKIYAAAEVFGATITEANAALVVVLGPNRYAFIGIRDHLPAVGFDMVGDTSQVLKTAGEFIGRVKQTGVSFYFVGEPGPDFDLSLFHPNSSLPDLFSGSSIAKTDAALGPLRQVSLVVPLSVLIVAIGVGGYFYDDYKATEAREARLQAARAAAAAQATKAVPDPKLAYAESVRAVIGNAVPAAASAEALLRAVGPLPDTATPDSRDWKFSKADCANLACTVTWTRDNDKAKTTNEAIVAARGDVRFLTDLKSAQEVLKIEPPSSAVVDIDSLPATQEFLIRTGSRFQVMKRAGLTVTLSADGGNSLPIVGTVPNGAPMDGISLVRIGTWEISGDYALRSALLELPANVTLTSLLVETTTAAKEMGRPGAPSQYPIKFTAKGNFYVR